MQIIIFTLGRERFALDTSIVYGIEKKMEITRVPTSPHYISGLTNLRGNIVTIADLKKYLGIQSDSGGENIIIIEIDEERIGLIVDSVHEVVNIDESIIEMVIDDSACIKGAINFNNNIVTLLDGELLLK